MRKMIVFALATVMVLSLAGCGSEPMSKTESRNAVPGSGTIDGKESSGISSSKNPMTGQEASTVSQTSEAADSESAHSSQASGHTGSDAENGSSGKPANSGNPDTDSSSHSGNAGSNGGNSNSGGNNSLNKPSTPPTSGNSDSNQPTEPEKPAGHVHNWIKEPKGLTVDWQGIGPDENGYTTNREQAKDVNGKSVGIYMCATCFEYYGADKDLWEVRYWEHADKTGHGGYSTYSVYAVYDLYFCEGCSSYKRGGFSFYGYYDYSDRNDPQWIYLNADQIAELNLPVR